MMIRMAIHKLSLRLNFDVTRIIEQYARYPTHPCSSQIIDLEQVVDEINPCLIHLLTMQRVSFMCNNVVYTVISDWYNYYLDDEITLEEMILYAEKDHLIRNAGHMTLSLLLFTELEEWIYFESLALRGIIHKNESFRYFDIASEINQYYQHNYTILSPVEKFTFRWIYMIEPYVI